MGYTKNYKPEKFLPIARQLEEIGEMLPGQSYEIKGSTETLTTVRWLVYDWLSHQGLRGSFKIRALPGRLLIECKAKMEQIEGRNLDGDHEVESALLQAISSEEPGRVLRSLLSGPRLASALEKLSRMLG